MKTKTTGTHHSVTRPHSDANHPNEKKMSPVTPCMDMYINRTATFFTNDKRRRIYFNIYAGFRFLEPVSQLNDLIVLRDLLTEVIDNEQKGKAIKTIIKLKNKK